MGMRRGFRGLGAGRLGLNGRWSGSRPGRACSPGVWVLLVWLGHLVPPGAAAEWSQFRGWNSTGVVETSPLPVRFGPRRNLVWRVSVPPGQSSPVLTRDRIFLSAVEGDRLWMICLDRSSGDLLWKQEVPRPRSEVMHRANGPASPTPVTDGSNVYAFFGDFGLISFDAEGRERWRLPLGALHQPHGAGRFSHSGRRQGPDDMRPGKRILFCSGGSNDGPSPLARGTPRLYPGVFHAGALPARGGIAAGAGRGFPSIDGLLGGQRRGGLVGTRLDLADEVDPGDRSGRALPEWMGRGGGRQPAGGSAELCRYAFRAGCRWKTGAFPNRKSPACA